MNSCISNKFSKNFIHGFTLENAVAESLVGIEGGENRTELEKKFLQGAHRLMEEGKFQPALSIVRSLVVNAPGQELKRLYGKVFEGYLKVLALSTPLFLGIPFCEVNFGDMDRSFNHLNSLKTYLHPAEAFKWQ